MSIVNSFSEKYTFLINFITVLERIDNPDTSTRTKKSIFRINLPKEWNTVEHVMLMSEMLELMDIPEYSFENECTVLVLPANFKLLSNEQSYLQNIPKLFLTDATDCGIFN